MYKFNFKKRELSTIFDDVTHFVMSMNFSAFSENIEDYSVIKYKNSIALALKAEVIEDFVILKIYDNGCQGKCSINGRYLSFSIQENGKYIYLT